MAQTSNIVRLVASGASHIRDPDPGTAWLPWLPPALRRSVPPPASSAATSLPSDGRCLETVT